MVQNPFLLLITGRAVLYAKAAVAAILTASGGKTTMPSMKMIQHTPSAMHSQQKLIL
jgi:hypothetical protein